MTSWPAGRIVAQRGQQERVGATEELGQGKTIARTDTTTSEPKILRYATYP